MNIKPITILSFIFLFCFLYKWKNPMMERNCINPLEKIDLDTFKKKLIPPTEYTSLTQYCLNSMFIELKISGFVIIKYKNSVMIRNDDL